MIDLTNKILKSDLNSPSKFKEKQKKVINSLLHLIKEEHKTLFSFDELSELLLSTCRVNDFQIIKRKRDNGLCLNYERIIKWIKEKLLPNTIILSLDEEDIIRLLIFSIEMTYQMFSGGTRATVTQKGFRERRRSFESILADQFVGKLGEVIFKKFIEKNFDVKIELDWDISTELEKYKNDIVNAQKRVSIKTSSTLAGVWAEADIGYDYGVAVKCSISHPPILQFFIEVCGFSKLLDFAENKIPSSDSKFREYLYKTRLRIKEYKCGEIKTQLKGFICGYFKTSEYTPVRENRKLLYLGKVRERRYLVPLSKLKYTKSDWKKFLKEIKLK